MISLQNVTKKYGKDVVAVNDVSFEISKGEFVFLTGKSGSGKTTLFKLLYKDEVPTGGDIVIFDKSMKKTKTKKLRRRIGVVFQDYKLLQNKTVYDNVSYPLSCLGVNPIKVKKETQLVLEKMKISHLSKKKVTELSGGEQQRVAIARAIVNKPEILLCDEPTGNLDTETTWVIMQHLIELNEAGTTIVMTTHSEDIVDKMQKRVIVLENGGLIKDSMHVKSEIPAKPKRKKDENNKHKIELLKEIGWNEEDENKRIEGRK